jgi:hypothetical protein
MAGERHHVIQKLLLRGFASRLDGDDAFAWQFRKGSAPKEVNLKHLSVSKHFYGTRDDISADDEITKFEAREISPLIQSLRSQRAATQLRDDRIPQFVAHFMVRTRTLREKFIEGSDYLIDSIRAYFRKPEMLDRLLPGLSSFSGELLPQFEKYFSALKTENPNEARRAHINTLKKNVSPPLRVEALSNLDWFLEIFQTPHLVIGDIGTLSRIQGSAALNSLPGPSDVLEHVFVPIASDRVLVGSQNGRHIKPKVDDLNSEFAAHSMDEFFASQKTGKELLLQEKIGTKADLISTSMVDELVRSLIAEGFDGPL